MASLEFGLRAGHLDATEQEVVFCHVCSFEWPRDQHESINCPRCHSEATEVIEPENDPRIPEVPDIPFPPSLRERLARNRPRRHDSDSDPDEGDIEEHVTAGPGGTFMRRTVFGSPVRSPDGRDRDPDRLGTGGRDDIMMRFADMLYQMGAGQHPGSPGGPGGPGDPGREPNFPPRPERATDDFNFGGPRIQRTTFRSGPLGGSVTITSSTIGGGPGVMGGPPDFNRLFGDLLRGPRSASPGERPIRPPIGPPLGIAAILQEIIGATINPQSAVHGDAVYTQEALDRIVSTLMEAHPQSNAAPPASQTAIEQLEKKKLTDEMIGPEGKAECTICIDEMHQGDDVTVLPCTHWFHGDCVTLWLKEHNTCPICRRAIETRDERRERRPTGSSPNADPRSPAEQSRSAAGPSSSESTLGDRHSPSGHTRDPRYPWDILGGSSRARMDYFASPPRQQDPDQQTGQDRNSPSLSRGVFYMGTNAGGGNPPPPSSSRPEMPGQYPSSGDQRERDQPGSSSSSSSRRAPLSIFGGDGGSRRENSSQSRDGGRGNSEANGSGSSSGSGGHNPFNWFRNHLPGGRNSGSGSGGGGAGSSSDNKDRDRRWRS